MADDRMDSERIRNSDESYYPSDQNTSDGLELAVRPLHAPMHRRAWIVFNSFIEKLVAVIFLLLSLPLFIVVPVIIKFQDGGSVFYISRRMGKDKQIFNMYKFRTLAPEAELKVGAQLLHHNHKLEIPYGRFLRETRLDEIPQLLNVIFGHMRFFGPRPERPSLYTEHCAHLPGYDRRFEVKPGLFGYSQIFTPHSTPKRLRTRIDNRYIDKGTGTGFVVFWVIGIMFFLLLRMVRKVFKLARTRISMKYRISQTMERRSLERIPQTAHKLEFDEVNTSTAADKFKFIDINEDCIFLHTNEELPDTSINFRLIIESNSLFSRKINRKTARIVGNILRHKQIDNVRFNNAYVISYSAYSPLNRYLIDKYLLKKSIL